jgi:hypothetical protein
MRALTSNFAKGLITPCLKIKTVSFVEEMSSQRQALRAGSPMAGHKNKTVTATTMTTTSTTTTSTAMTSGVCTEQYHKGPLRGSFILFNNS